MSEYLSPAELVDLTDARTRPAQERWLVAKGFKYVVSSKGHVKVLRAHRDVVLGLGIGAPREPAEPDFSVFDRTH
jgi:hypothetical protein